MSYRFNGFVLLLLFIDVLNGKPISIARNVSDCSVTDDGILLYHGKLSFTKFHHECLPWHELQTIYSELITEPNFFTDASIFNAKNFCRNPNLTRQGPWCFVEDADEIRMEECGVCQSLKPQNSSPIEDEEEKTIPPINRKLLHQIRDELKRYALLLREKFLEIVQRIQKKGQKLISRLSERFQFNGK